MAYNNINYYKVNDKECVLHASFFVIYNNLDNEKTK